MASHQAEYQNKIGSMTASTILVHGRGGVFEIAGRIPLKTAQNKYMDNSSFNTLLACLDHAEFDQARSDRLSHISTEEWQEVATLASLHSVAPLLYYRLKQHTLAIPDDVAILFKDAYLNNIARNVRLYAELTRILQCFQDANIPVVVLKGAHLAEVIYGNIGLRPMGDVDLLVQKDDLKKVDREL